MNLPQNPSPVRPTKFVCTCLFPLAFAFANAQVAPAPEPVPTVPPGQGTAPVDVAGKEETMTLSPFTVKAERDVGFVAASSFSGGRLATDLKDTPLAYSVMTRDFLDALQLKDTEEALLWAVSAYSSPNDGTDKIFNLDSGSNIKLRGVLATGVQRNFFLLGVSSDTYSQERIDLARGPNALLIGNSTLGGSIVSMTKRARPGQPFVDLKLSVGSDGERRAVLDVNRSLNDKVAVRVSALGQDSDTWRDSVFDRRKGLFGAVTARPFAHTEIRAEWETYENEALQALNAPVDRISGWDGATVFNAPTAAFAPANAAGVSRLGSSTAPYIVVVPGDDQGRAINYANTWTTLGGGSTAQTPVGGVLPLSTANLGVNGAVLLSARENLPDNAFGLAAANSLFRVPGREFVTAPNGPTATYEFDDAALFVEQQLGRHVFLELAGNHAQTQRLTEYIVSRGLNEARIDINRNLPTGEANPHFLDVYGDSSKAGHTYFNKDIWDGRFGAAVVFDGTRWGDFRANVIYGRRSEEATVRQDTEVMERNADLRQRPFLDTFSYRYYWNDPDRPLPATSSLTYVDPVGGTTQSHGVSDIVDISGPGNQRAAKTTYDYLQSAFNARLWNGRINLIAGLRHDRFHVTASSLNNSATAVRYDYPTNWDGHTVYYRPAAPDDYNTLTYVPKNAGGVATGPATLAITRPRDANGRPLDQYSGDRFRDDYGAPDIDQSVTTVTYGGIVHGTDWISGFFNFAESFNPSLAGQTVTGDLIPPQLAEGWDAGVRFNLLDGRVIASVGRYSSTQKNNGFDAGGTVRGMLSGITEANARGDASTNGRNTRGLAEIPSPYFDFQDLEAEGTEIDIVANLTRNWRLTANYARPEVRNTNRYGDTWAYITANEPTLRQIVLDAGGLIGTNNTATVDTSIPSGEIPDAATAVAGWNSLQAFKLTNPLSITSTTATLKYTANIFTDYRFAKGPLKNLRAGLGVQFRGPNPIGNRGADTVVNPANAAAAIDNPDVDAMTLVYMPSYHLVTGTLGYEVKLKGFRLQLDLRISNLLDEDTPVFIGTALRPPNGDLASPARVASPSSFYYLQPRSYTLSASMRF